MTFDDLKEFLLNNVVSIDSCQALLLKTLVDFGGTGTIDGKTLPSYE